MVPSRQTVSVATLQLSPVIPAPHSLAVDHLGNLYVSDWMYNTVLKVSPDGQVSVFAGVPGQQGSEDGPGKLARFFYPTGVAVDLGGNIFVADMSNHVIRKITPEGVVTTLAGAAGQVGHTDGQGSQARFHCPRGVAVDASGLVYVADTWNDVIRTISPDGMVATVAGVPGIQSRAAGPDGESRFYRPCGIGLDEHGNIFVADTYNHTIRKVSRQGVISTLAGLAASDQNGYPIGGVADGQGADARFQRPSGVAVDHAGHVYVADTGNNILRRITPDGLVSTVAGLAGKAGKASGSGEEARFDAPVGLTIDLRGHIFVADSKNCSIRQVTVS